YKDVSTRPMSGISKSLLGGVDSIPLDPPQPGFNDGSFFRAPAHQRRIGVEFFKVAAYRNDVGNNIKTNRPPRALPLTAATSGQDRESIDRVMRVIASTMRRRWARS